MIWKNQEFTVKCDNRGCGNVLTAGFPHVIDKKSMAIYAAEQGWKATNSKRTPDVCPLCQGSAIAPVDKPSPLFAHPMGMERAIKPSIDSNALNGAVDRILAEEGEPASDTEIENESGEATPIGRCTRCRSLVYTAQGFCGYCNMSLV